MGRSLLPEAVERYALEHTTESDVARRLREETSRLPEGRMQIGPDQAAFFSLLVRAIDAHVCLEVGTFTGYSALAVASALPAEGRLIACDVSEEWTDIGRRYWQEAGVADRIDLIIGPASETLQELLESGLADGVDFAFIDADKPSTDAYFELCLKLVRPGGLIAVDNVIWSGRVADPAVDDPDTQALRAFNSRVRRDPRVDVSLLTIGDGVLLARRR
jgi:predicted O-methyltransferase YrrM